MASQNQQQPRPNSGGGGGGGSSSSSSYSAAQAGSISNLESVTSVCKVNFVASSVLARDPVGRAIDLDFGPNHTFPTVRIL